MHLIGHCLQAHVAQPATARCRRGNMLIAPELRTAADAVLFPLTPEPLGRHSPHYAKQIHDHLQNPYHGIPCTKRRVPVLRRPSLVGAGTVK